VTDPADTPLHVFNQHARALLPPVGLELAALEARLDRFARRLRLSDAEQELVASARDAVAAARARVNEQTDEARKLDGGTR
jgi:hypothetical protein